MKIIMQLVIPKKKAMIKVKKVKMTPKFTINTKVVHAIKKLQALYNDDANEIIKQTTKEKNVIEN